MLTASQAKKKADDIRQSKIDQNKNALKKSIEDAAKCGNYTFSTKAYLGDYYNKELKKWLIDLGYTVSYKKGLYFNVSWEKIK